MDGPFGPGPKSYMRPSRRLMAATSVPTHHPCMEFIAGKISPRAAGRPSQWERRLDGARSADEVLELTRDYLRSLAPEHFARLPEDCRPGPIKYDDDIDYWAYRLGQRYCAENDEPVDGSLLHDLLDYFLHALIRLAELRRNLPGAVRIEAQ